MFFCKEPEKSKCFKKTILYENWSFRFIEFDSFIDDVSTIGFEN